MAIGRTHPVGEVGAAEIALDPVGMAMVDGARAEPVPRGPPAAPPGAG